jgi:hypothetical protein
MYESARQLTIPVTLDNPSNNPTSVTLKVWPKPVPMWMMPTRGKDYLFNDTTITWPAGVAGSIRVPITIINDTVHELEEDLYIVAENATNGALIIDSVFNLNIIANDLVYHDDCANIFFSQYIDGSGNNKALQIYNPTTDSIELSDYQLVKFTDGDSSSDAFILSGILAPKGVYVIANPLANAAITLLADTLTPFINFDGNDALALVQIYDTVDVIGEPGINPGIGWPIDTASTAGHTLIRKYFIYAGQTNWAIADTQWRAYGIDMFDSLGFHHTNSPCGMPEPPLPATLTFISADQSILEGDTSITVVLRVQNPSSVSARFAVARDDVNSTATGGSDYLYTNQVYSHGFGLYFDTVHIMVKDDALVEPTETVLLKFINRSSNIILGPDSVYTLSIIDTDILKISFLGAGFAYTEDAGQVEVKVTLSGPVDSAVSVRVKLASGNATQGSDFYFNDTTVIFPPNTVDTQGVWITIVNDTIPEVNEQVNFDLLEISNGPFIAISAYTLTIVDNDSLETGIGDPGLDTGIKIFPNPAHSKLYVETGFDISEVHVSDLTGKLLIAACKLYKGKSALDLSGLAPGMYFLSVNDNGVVSSRKFIKEGD